MSQDNLRLDGTQDRGNAREGGPVVKDFPIVEERGAG